MKLISYLKAKEEHAQLAILVGEKAYDTHRLDKRLPDNMAEFLWGEDETMVMAKSYNEKIKRGENVKAKGIPIQDLALMSPVPYPSSLRGAFGFQHHWKTVLQNCGQAIPPNFDVQPIFHFLNHQTIQGGGQLSYAKDLFRQLDFGLEVAAVIGVSGTNIEIEEAEDFIAGYMVMNNFCDRHWEKQELKMGMGIAKAKDFATSIGPCLLTPDELKTHICSTPVGHEGTFYDLKMRAWVNGQLISEGTMADMYWTFEEIIAHCSTGIDLLPGDVIASGTMGMGCFLDVYANDSSKKQAYLQAGDVVTLEVEKLGKLEVRVV